MANPRKRKLTDTIKGEIIDRFACRYGVEEVRKWLLETHGIELTPPAFSYYNANNTAAYLALPEKWQRRFDESRQQYLAVVRAPIAFKAHRLELADRLVNRIVDKIESGTGTNVVLVEKAQALLEYAAKEDGGMFTNRREITGRGGGPIEMATRLAEVPDADLFSGRDDVAARAIGAG